MDIRSVRRALDLRLVDVSRAVGIAASRLSLAERGLTRLTTTERRAVEDFLAQRVKSEIEVERRERSR